jgi:hypothetical protein
MLSIAKNLGCTITPVVIDHIDHFNGIIGDQVFRVFVDSTRNVIDVGSEVKKIEELYKRKLRLFSYK